jgi:uncharacterized membrane protein (DUF485 family)
VTAAHGPHHAAQVPHRPPGTSEDLLDLVIDAADSDSMEEVEAVVRGLRRAALRYALLLTAMMVTVPVLAALSPGWFSRPIWGGITPNFLSLALVLPALFVMMAIRYERFASHVEDQMLGRREEDTGGPDA